MKLSLWAVEQIIIQLSQVETELAHHVIPDNITISEFDSNIERKIQHHFDDWLSMFSKWETIVNIKHQLQSLLSNAFHKYGLDNDLAEYEKTQKFITVFSKLSKMDNQLPKNEILGKLTKMSDNRDMIASVETSFMPSDVICDFSEYEKSHIINNRNLMESINKRKIKHLIEIDDGTVQSLKTYCII